MKEKLRYVTNNMKSYRNRLGYTQEKMADLLNVHINFLLYLFVSCLLVVALIFINYA